MEKEIKQKEETEEETKKRTIVVPGEVVATGSAYLPGEGTRRDGNDIIASKFGLLEKSDKLIKIIPLSGAYIPRVGNTVIGQVIDVTFNGWQVDIASPQLAFLPVSECFGFINKMDLNETYTFRDMIVTKIKSIKSRGIDVSMRERGLRRLEGGMIIKINPTRVPRVIGRAGSMANIIKDEANCSLVVGQNGIVWIRGISVENELLAKEAIELIVEKPFVAGLTEKIKEFLVKRKKELGFKEENIEKKEIKEEKETKEKE